LPNAADGSKDEVTASVETHIQQLAALMELIEFDIQLGAKRKWNELHHEVMSHGFGSGSNRWRLTTCTRVRAMIFVRRAERIDGTLDMQVIYAV
jgi:hypothetical protein